MAASSSSLPSHTSCALRPHLHPTHQKAGAGPSSDQPAVASTAAAATKHSRVDEGLSEPLLPRAGSGPAGAPQGAPRPEVNLLLT